MLKMRTRRRSVLDSQISRDSKLRKNKTIIRKKRIFFYHRIDGLIGPWRYQWNENAYK